MSKYRVLLIIPVILVLLLSWYIVGSNKGTKLSKQKELLSQAAVYAEDKIYVKAVPLAEEAYAIDTEIRYSEVEKILMNYYKLGEYTDKYYKLIETRISNDRADKDEYLQLAQYHFNNRDSQECLEILKKGILKFDGDKLPLYYGIEGLKGKYDGEPLFEDELTEFYEKNRYSFSMSTFDFEEIGLINNGFMTVQNSETGLWAIYSISGKQYTDYIYSEITDVSAKGFVSAKLDNEYVLVNYNGTRYALCKTDLVNGLVRTEGENRSIVICSDNKMYSASDFKLAENGYDYIGAASEGFRAMNSSGKWYFNSSGKEQLNIECSEILVNSYGEAMISGRAFIKRDNRYILIDNSGNESENTFDNAKPFCKDGQLAAVEKDGKWGFADRYGNIVIECIYDDAQSFSPNGIGIVKDNDGKWHFIDVRGNLIDGYEFDDVREMRDNCATVNILGKWAVISIK